jgi:molecular chaperone GrpE (heat shock protein)
MNVTTKLSEIIDKLEIAVSYENWDSVEDVIKELNFLYEEMESSFPMDGFDDDY